VRRGGESVFLTGNGWRCGTRARGTGRHSPRKNKSDVEQRDVGGWERIAFSARTVGVALSLCLVDVIVEAKEVDAILKGRASSYRASLCKR
jgi:hypothetical protein